MLNRASVAVTFCLALVSSALVGCGTTTPAPKTDEAKTVVTIAPAPAAIVARRDSEPRDVVLLGPSALYYMYKTDSATGTKTAAASPREHYRLSRYGRVYYRDSAFRPHWVTPPRDGIRVPSAQATAYSDFAGYNASPEGRDLVGLADE